MKMKRILTLSRSGPFWNALGSTMYGANSVLLLTLVNRCLGVEASGVFGIAFTTAQLLWIVGIFGAEQFQMTDYSEQYSFSAYSETKIISSLLMAVCAGLACLGLGFTKEKTVLTSLLTAYMMAHSVSDLFQNRFFQLNRLDLSGKCLFFRTLFSLVCFALGLWLTRKLYVSAAILALANIAAVFLFSYFPCRKFIPAFSVPSKTEILSLIRACLPLFVSMFLMNFLMQLPKYAIERHINDTAQGIFNMIFMPAYVINLISGFIYAPMLKPLSDAVSSGDKKEILHLLTRPLIIIGVFTAVCCLGVWLCGVEVLGWFYGADLSGQRLPLLLIIVGGGLFACCQLIYYVILILRRQGLIMIDYALCLMAALLVCPALVKKSGIMGAALSFVVIQLLLILIYLAFAAFLFLRGRRSVPGGKNNG